MLDVLGGEVLVVLGVDGWLGNSLFGGWKYTCGLELYWTCAFLAS